MEDRSGKFYTIRGLQDDLSQLSNSVEPLRFLDPILHIRRIAEAIDVCLNFIQAMNYVRSEVDVAFAFRWTKLRGRMLYAWANPRRSLRQGTFKSSEDEHIEVVSMSADMPQTRIWEFVSSVACGLMRCFAGYDRIDPETIKGIVEETFARRF